MKMQNTRNRSYNGVDIDGITEVHDDQVAEYTDAGFVPVYECGGEPTPDNWIDGKPPVQEVSPDIEVPDIEVPEMETIQEEKTPEEPIAEAPKVKSKK